VDDDDVTDWLDRWHVNFFRGDNNQDFSDLQDELNEYLEKNDEPYICYRVRFQRLPASGDEETENIFFYFHMGDDIDDDV
jgi:hypothetical protein